VRSSFAVALELEDDDNEGPTPGVGAASSVALAWWRLAGAGASRSDDCDRPSRASDDEDDDICPGGPVEEGSEHDQEHGAGAVPRCWSLGGDGWAVMVRTSRGGASLSLLLPVAGRETVLSAWRRQNLVVPTPQRVQPGYWHGRRPGVDAKTRGARVSLRASGHTSSSSSSLALDPSLPPLVP
jgi:hypothetical protein